jgi:hypothetical protein
MSGAKRREREQLMQREVSLAECLHRCSLPFTQSPDFACGQEWRSVGGQTYTMQCAEKNWQIAGSNFMFTNILTKNAGQTAGMSTEEEEIEKSWAMGRTEVSLCDSSCCCAASCSRD